MPLPTPNAGESESDFMARCIPVVEDEGKPHDQAVAICLRQFRENRSADNVPETKHFDVPFEIKTITEAGEFEGYASVFDTIDLHDDRVAQGAFEASLAEWRDKGRLPPMLWQHNMDEPIGVFTEMAEDDKGLHVKGQLLIDDVAKAREARALMVHKVLGGLSIGFMTVRDSFDQRSGVRTLEQVKLMEVSAVTFPANEAAMIEQVRSIHAEVKAGRVLSDKNRRRLMRAIEELNAMVDEAGLGEDDDKSDETVPSRKECERALRNAGISRNMARAVIAEGHGAVVSESERNAGKQTEAEERFAKWLEEATETASILFHERQEG